MECYTNVNTGYVGCRFAGVLLYMSRYDWGRQYSAFLNVKEFDEELIVRSCQVHALMPMMQFSVAPWRILSKENADICAHYAHLHQKMSGYILELAKRAAETGEPIVRSMEYEYPHQGFTDCKDQYMLGDKYLVAPIGDSRSKTYGEAAQR